MDILSRLVLNNVHTKAKTILSFCLPAHRVFWCCESLDDFIMFKKENRCDCTQASEKSFKEFSRLSRWTYWQTVLPPCLNPYFCFFIITKFVHFHGPSSETYCLSFKSLLVSNLGNCLILQLFRIQNVPIWISWGAT